MKPTNLAELKEQLKNLNVNLRDDGGLRDDLILKERALELVEALEKSVKEVHAYDFLLNCKKGKGTLSDFGRGQLDMLERFFGEES